LFLPGKSDCINRWIKVKKAANAAKKNNWPESQLMGEEI